MCERAGRGLHFPANFLRQSGGGCLASLNFIMVSLSMGRVLPFVYLLSPWISQSQNGDSVFILSKNAKMGDAVMMLDFP